MATGIVSIAILLDGSETLSRALLVVAAGGWLAGALLLLRGLAGRSWRRRAIASISSLTAVAGTAVLGTRLTLLGWSWAGWALLAPATALCLVLLARLAGPHARPRSGSAFLVVVAPQSVSVLAASLAARLALSWLAAAAVVPLAYGLRDYARTLTRFDLRELRMGAGDHWIAGGAIAISTLACADLARATGVLRAPSGMHDLLRVATVVLWALTMAWLPALVGAEALWRLRRRSSRLVRLGRGLRASLGMGGAGRLDRRRYGRRTRRDQTYRATIS